MFQALKTRSNEEELMDDFEMSGEQLEKALDQIGVVNTWLGGNKIMLNGIQKIFKLQPSLVKDQPIKILDLGCGGGDGLRTIAEWGRRNDIPLELKGVDANLFTVEYAKGKSKSFPEIQFLQADVLADICYEKDTSIIVFGLFLHHFTNEQIESLLLNALNAGAKALLINDLHRHWLAYILFNLACRTLGASYMTRNDGLLSIKKGFRKMELHSLLSKNHITNYYLRWKWAFRYQLIIFNESYANT